MCNSNFERGELSLSNNFQPDSVDLCLFTSDLLFFNYHKTSVGIVGIPTEVDLKKKLLPHKQTKSKEFGTQTRLGGEISKSDIIM